MNSAVGHKEYFAALAALEDDRLKVYTDEAAASVQRQREVEASDEIGFDDYLKQYFSEQGCCD